MVRSRLNSRYTLLLVAVGLFAAFLAAVPAAHAQVPQGDLFVVASDQGNAGVGGQGWTGDTTIDVEVLDDSGAVRATATNDGSPDPDSGYWWGAHTGITIEPGWTVTATGAQSGHSVTTVVSDVVVEGWDDTCKVYGTTTYDPVGLRVDVYSIGPDSVDLSRYVTWNTDDGGVHSWEADFCVSPGAGESGELIGPLVDPAGQAIHHDGGLGATMWHYAPPQPPAFAGSFNVTAVDPMDGVWGCDWGTETRLEIAVDDPASPESPDYTFPIDSDASGCFGTPSELWGFDIRPGHVVTVATGAASKTLTVSDLTAAVSGRSDRVWGSATPGAEIHIHSGSDNQIVLADGATGFYEADFGGASGIDHGTSGAVIEFDDDGDATAVNWTYWTPSPRIAVNVDSDFILGHDWEPGSEVAVSLTRGTQTWNWTSGIVEWHRGFGIDPGMNIEPGDSVEMTDGTFTKAHGVVDLSAAEDDVAGVIVAGWVEPAPVAHLGVQGWADDGSWASRSRPIGANPLENPEYVDLKTLPGPDGEEGTITGSLTGALAEAFEADLDSTIAYFGEIPAEFTGIGGGDPGDETPWIRAVVWPKMSIQGESWHGAAVTVDLDKGGDGTIDMSKPVPVDTYEEGRYHDGSHFDLSEPFWQTWTLEPGDVVTVTGSGGGADGVVKTLTVEPLSVTGVNADTNTVTGTGSDADTITVMRWGDDVGNPHTEVTTTVSAGIWSGTLPDLWPGSGGAAVIWDEDGDGTEAQWGAAFMAAGIDVRDGENPVWGGFWYFDSSVTVEVFRDAASVHGPVTAPGGEGWWAGFGVDLAPFDLQVGDTVVVVGAESMTTQTHTVMDLFVDWADWQPDGSGNRVFGTVYQADGLPVPDGTVVRVEAHGHDAHRWTTTVGGSWSVDYDDPVPDSGELEIQPGVGGRVEVLGAEGNRTYSAWGTEGLGEEHPVLSVNVSQETRVAGDFFEGPNEVRVLDDPGCPFVYTFEGGFDISSEELCDTGELSASDVVAVSTPEGELVREHTMFDLVVTRVDAVADTISGLATIEVPVEVWIFDTEEGAGDGAFRRTVPNPDGTWSVSFMEPPDEGDEYGQMEIDGREGTAQQTEEDGDYTGSDWRDSAPHVYVNLLEDFMVLSEWPTGSPVSIDVFESDADGAPLVYAEVIAAPGPYYLLDTQTGLGGIDLLSGHHVVASNGVVTVAHTVTELAISTFDFANDALAGTAFPDTTVAAGAWNESSEGEVEATRDVVEPTQWTADLAGQVDFSLYNRIEGYAAEFDAGGSATFFYFVAEYEELVVDPGETSVTTSDGSVTVDNLGEGDSIEIVEAPADGSDEGFESVGQSIDIQTDAPPRSVEAGDVPYFLKLRIRGDEIPPGLDLDDVIVLRDGVEVPDCVLPLDSDDDFPCVSERVRDEATEDVELTVQTLEFSVWTMAVRSVTVGEFGSADDPVGVGTSVSAAATLVDVGKTQATTLTGAFTWGDGTCDVAVPFEDAIAATHEYQEAGVYSVGFALYAGTAADCSAAAQLRLIDEAEYRYVVVYDPDGGFVTGGGWIDSPAGAYRADPGLFGVATFGFVSKYVKKSDVPVGQTEFAFEMADLSFRSDSYEWLIVAGPKAMYKGVGWINGEGEYKFLISVIDAELTASSDTDRFRIKIWEEMDTGAERIVYDNLVAEDPTDDADPTTELGGGSIVIHKARKK